MFTQRAKAGAFRQWMAVGLLMVWAVACAAAQPKTAGEGAAKASAGAPEPGAVAAKSGGAGDTQAGKPAALVAAATPAPAMAKPTTATAATAAGEGVPTTPAEPLGQASPEVVAILEKISKAHGGMRTLSAEFDQVKVWTEANEEVRSSGKVSLQMPDRLRCEYDRPDPSVLLMADRKLYQFVPSLAQVDVITFASDEEAREQFRMMLLGLGMSGAQVLTSYNVTQEPADPKEPGLTVLAFVPVNQEIRNVVTRIVVWFDSEKWLPRKVRKDEVGGDVTTIEIRPGKFQIDAKIDEKVFRPDWPSRVNGHRVKTIEHSPEK